MEKVLIFHLGTQVEVKVDVDKTSLLDIIVHAKIDPHNVVSAWYSVRTYKLSYSFSINPIPDQNQWPAYDDLPIVMPPACAFNYI